MKIEDKIYNFYFFAEHTFEPWDYMNPILYGIGGSETSQIEMSSRLASRHHNVVSYAPVPWAKEAKEKVHRGVTWKNYEDATFKEEGIWVVYRAPEALDHFTKEHKEQEVWFVAQDVSYEKLNEERAEKIDKYICLCSDHANYIAFKHPYLAEKIVVSSNGINVDLINDIEKQNFKRNPHRLIYSSSPDRGLEQLIPIFKKAKEFVSDLELHVFYGFDNIDKVIQRMPWVARMKDSIMSGINSTDGIFWHGRVGQIDLLCEWFQSGIWCYPINFTETSCISCMEAQACGVIPVISPVWALRENVMHGVMIEGDVQDKLTLAKFTGEIIRLCKDANNLTERIRYERGNMQMDAKVRFNWERYVDQWESWLVMPEGKSIYNFAQYAFQQRFADGKILNIGCDVDSSNFKGLRGAVNLDVQQNTAGTVDIIADARHPHLARGFTERYDTVIVGDMIEHMTHEDAVLVLKNAKNFLKDYESKLIITCPHDARPKEIQNPTYKGDETYLGGVSQFHRLITKDELIDITHEAGLLLELSQDIDYTHFKGTGLICTLQGAL